MTPPQNHLKPPEANRLQCLIKIPDIPLQSEIETIIADVYAEFSVPERQLRIAKEDLKTTYRELQRIRTEMFYLNQEAQKDRPAQEKDWKTAQVTEEEIKYEM